MKRVSVRGRRLIRGRKKGLLAAVVGIFRSLGSSLFKVLTIFVVTALVSFCFLFLYNYLLDSPYLKLQRVEVKGVDKKIGNSLIGTCGLSTEQSLMALNLRAIKQKMEKHPWVRSVHLERKFPHTLIVRVEKERPRALVVMDHIYYMNRWGEIFKEVAPTENMDFPVVTGEFKDGSAFQKQLDKAAQVLEALVSYKGLWSLKELSEVHVDRDGGLSLYFTHIAAEIQLNCENLEGKLDGLKRVAAHLIRTGRIRQVKDIDLNYDDGAVVSFRSG